MNTREAFFGFSRRVKPKALLLVLTLRVTPTATRLALAKG